MKIEGGAMQYVRRQLLKAGMVATSFWSLGACSQQQDPKVERVYTEEEKQRMHKFRGIGGFSFVTSGFGKSSEEGIDAVVFDDQGHGVITYIFWEGGGGEESRGIFPPGIWKYLNVKVFENSTVYRRSDISGWYESLDGKIAGQWKVPIADRIPDDLLDDLRRDPKGSLRIKIRLHREGVLLGWDIERRPGFDPKKRDSFGEIAYVSPGWVKTGGDFKEARFLEWVESANGTLIRAPDKRSINGVVPPELAVRGIRLRNGFLWEPGWYIHPKTGQHIETDF